MTLHSLPFVPNDSERKLAKFEDTVANALILDLEDAVTSEHKPAARELARAFPTLPRTGARKRPWVRINALNTRDSRIDLAAIVAARPCGLMVPKVDHASELINIGADLDSLEAQAGIAVDATHLIPMLESPQAVLTVADYLRTHLDRVSGNSWGAKNIGASIGNQETI